MKKQLFLFLLLTFFRSSALHVLHVGLDSKILEEFENVVYEVDVDVTSVVMQDWAKENDFDGKTTGNAIYNVTHQVAHDVWERHKEFFNEFDVVLVSGCVPLARVFLQNDWSKPLIVWVNRPIDYFHYIPGQKRFPDKGYINLIKESVKKDNVFFIASSFYHDFYVQKKYHFNLGSKIIGFNYINNINKSYEEIPDNIDVENTFVVSSSAKNNSLLNLKKHCEGLGISAYSMKDHFLDDLEDFRGIIHIPSTWDAPDFYESIFFGIPYFIPSRSFLNKLMRGKKVVFPFNFYMKKSDIRYSEWYLKENEGKITYFDSWDDLKNKIESTDFQALRRNIEKYYEDRSEDILSEWRNLFLKINSLVQTSDKSSIGEL